MSIAEADAQINVLAGLEDGVQVHTGPTSVEATWAKGGSHTTKARATAGSGGLVLGGASAESEAISSGSVRAFIGNSVQLAKDSLTIRANSTTSQDTWATGVGVGGIAFGLAKADSESNVVTRVDLGTDVSSNYTATENATRNWNGTITVAANGTDTNQAEAIAGTGGIVNGAAADATTKDTSTTTVTIGDRTRLQGNQVTINATHIDQFQGETNAINASVVGGSGSKTRHTANATTTISIGNNVHLTSNSNEKIAVHAESQFRQMGSGPSARGAAGGVFSGNSVESRTNLTSNTTVTTGNAVIMHSGVDPVSNRGGINIWASTTLGANDNVTLTTGGAITNASVLARLNANITNTVNIGTNNSFSTLGRIDIGTYTLSTVSSDAGVSTYGIAAVGQSDAYVDVISNQTVSVAAGSILEGFDNVSVTAGSADRGSRNTTITNNVRSVGYVRGLIAVPHSTAESYATSNATVNVASGAKVQSGQNVTVGAYSGTVITESYGKGHGYQLGFIPTSNSDSRRNSTISSVANINGDVTAGLYHTLNIVIDCPTGPCTTGSQTRIRQLQNADGSYGAPVLTLLDTGFNPHTYLDANFDSDTATTLKSGMSSAPVSAYRLGQLFASGGNITVHADQINLGGTLTANGGPTISLLNSTAAYVVIDGGAFIPDVPGGQVLFTGAAEVSGAGVREVNGSGPSIIISNTFNGDVGNVEYGPGLFIAGDVTNLGGGVIINNTTGSVGQTGNVSAQQLSFTVPQGVFAVSALGPNGRFDAAGAPFADWREYALPSTINPALGAPSARQGVVYAINARFPSSSEADLNEQLYSTNSSSDRTSYVYFGVCGVPDMGRCGYDLARSYFPRNPFDLPITGETIDNAAVYQLSSQSWYARVPRVTTSRNVNVSTNPGAPSTPLIFGSQVAIKATVINVNGRIEAGQKTDWSVRLGSSAESIIASARAAKASGSRTAGTIDLSAYTSTTRSADEKIGAKYDIASDTIVLDEIRASSGGGHILLDGKIINTRANTGQIHINGGLGDVDIDNQTSAQLNLQRVNTGSLDAGSAPVSVVKIVDRLKGGQTTTNVFTPGQGIKTYITSNGADPVLTGPGATAPVFSTASN
ncbi:MAG: hypothetical protein AAFO75_03650, partial [Pseudomonadota bacterium]